VVAASALGQDFAKTETSERNWAILHHDGYTAFTDARYPDAFAVFQASLPLASTLRERAMTLANITSLTRRADVPLNRARWSSQPNAES